MEIFRQIARGWLYSLAAPFIVSILVGLGSAVFGEPWRGEDTFATRVEMGIATYLVWSFLGLQVTAIAVGTMGTALFYIVSRVDFLHPLFFCFVGCVLGSSLVYQEVWWFMSLFSLYGGVAAWLFWYGAVKRQSAI